MPFLINIGFMKTNGVVQNANIDVGATIQNSHTANAKYVGLNLSLGDLSPTIELSGNLMLDTDISDQDQIGNPSAPIAGQL